MTSLTTKKDCPITSPAIVPKGVMGNISSYIYTHTLYKFTVLKQLINCIHTNKPLSEQS
jgi:hypothetical protein